MLREKSNAKDDSERPDQQRITLNAISNSFNPPLSRSSKSPLPAIPNQEDKRSSPNKSLAITKTASSGNTADLVLPTKVFKAKKSSVNDLSQAACSHLWFRRIKEIFLVMGKQNDPFSRFDMELARADMIQTCEQYLESERPKFGGADLSPSEQTKLDRWKNKRLYGETFRLSYFRKELDSDERTTKPLTQTELSGGEVPNFDNAIWWYTCNEAPIFDQMNNILRLESFELLMCHRYYISDLCQMIERSNVQNKLSQKLKVFRADKLSRADFETIKKSKEQKDATITINGFISTSKNEKISREYAEAKLKKRGDDVVIMYEITIDPAIPCSAFADVEAVSFHPREREVLFNMGSTFRIDDIEDDGEIKRIKLTAHDYNVTLLDEMKAKVKQSSQATLRILLVRYLIELGEDRVSKRYLNQLIDSKQLENDPNLVAVYNCLGTIYSRQALYGEALEYYRKALNTQARLQFSNNNALAEIFNNIGQAHLGLKQLEEAQQNLDEGVRIQKREARYAQQHLASLYCNIGQVAYARDDEDEAEKNFQMAYDLYNRKTKIAHDALEKRLLTADLCVAFGQLKSVQNPKDPTEANKKFEEALRIYESTLPSSHPKVTETHIGIVCEYARNENFQSVIKYYHEHLISLLKDYEMKQTTSQQDLANLHAIIGACFVHEKEFDKAMEVWKKGIEHEQKVFLDQLLSSARIARIQLPIRLLHSAYRAALDHYSSINDTPREYFGILYAKTYVYDKVVEYLRGQSSFLLANICIAQRNFKGSMIVYKRLLEVQDYDLTLMISILLRLLTLKKTTSNDEPIAELLRMEKLLASKVPVNEAIRLRMIMNDSLAETYLAAKNYDEALRHSRISYELKQRHYSAYHPSLVRNCKLAASCSFQQGDYKTAVQYYEKAVEIQLDNMPGGHTDIRANYFLLGDCYCLMDKIEFANEFYDRAQAPFDADANDEKEVERDVKALIRMHSNLANAVAKQKDFSSASTHQQDTIDLLKEIMPAYVVTLIEDKNAASMTFDHLQTLLITRLGLPNGRTFAQVLRNFVYIYFSFGRALLHADQRTDSEEDSTDLYGQAIGVQLKLTMFEKTEGKRLAIMYEEQSGAHSKLFSTLTETIQENLLKALEEFTDKQHQRALEFRLGNLYFEEKEYSNAQTYWTLALGKVKDSETTIKTILEKLIEKNKENISNSDDDSDDDDDDDDAGDENDGDEDDGDKNEVEDEKGETDSRPQSKKSQRPVSVKSQRRLSTKSTNDKEKPEDLSQAYLDLEDHASALKYFKKYAVKLEELVKPTWPSIEIEDEQLSVIKFFHSQLVQIIASTGSSLLKSEEIPNKDVWTNLLQVYMNIFKLSVKVGSSSDEIGKANLATFEICQKLYNIPNHLVTIIDLLFNHESDKLQWKELITLLSPEEANNILMRIAAYYIAKDEHDDALEIYCTLQNQQTSNSAVNYGILKLFESNLSADEDYRANIVAIDFRSSNIPIFDRIILCRLAISFWEELKDETKTQELEKELLNLQSKPWNIDDLETIDCIGHLLTKVEDYTLACSYWDEIQDIYHEMLPHSIIGRLDVTDCSFEQILRATQDMSDELSDNVLALAESYKLLANYKENDRCNEDACDALETAIVIWSKISSTKDNLVEYKTKVNMLKSK